MKVFRSVLVSVLFFRYNEKQSGFGDEYS